MQGEEHADSLGLPRLVRILTFSDLLTAFFSPGFAFSFPLVADQSNHILIQDLGWARLELACAVQYTEKKMSRRGKDSSFQTLSPGILNSKPQCITGKTQHSTKINQSTF